MDFSLRTLATLCSTMMMLIASPAWSGPDYASSSDLIEPNGFPGVCSQPCYVAGVETEVWLELRTEVSLSLLSAGGSVFRWIVTSLEDSCVSARPGLSSPLSPEAPAARALPQPRGPARGGEGGRTTGERETDYEKLE